MTAGLRVLRSREDVPENPFKDLRGVDNAPDITIVGAVTRHVAM